MRQRRHARKGSTLVEFTLVGIPAIFLLILTCEMGRWAWTYHTLAHAASEGARYATVHGNNCAGFHNNCTVKASAVASVIRNAGLGLDPGQLTVTLRAEANAARTIGPVSLTTLLGQTSRCWPVNDDCTAAVPGATTKDDVTVELTYGFRSMFVFFWPGAGAGSMRTGQMNLRANARERVHF